MPPQIRIIKAHLELDELHERHHNRPLQRLALPSPRPAAVAIAITVIEVQAGVRSPWHLERISHYSLWPLWDLFARPAPPDPAATAARALAVVVQELTPGLVDATVVVQFAGTAHPLALSLDGAQGRWELMELECPSDLTPDPPADIPDPAADIPDPAADIPDPAADIPDPAADIPDPAAPTPVAAHDPPKPGRPPTHPSGITLPWTGRWPPPELGTQVDPFDSPGIDFG